MNGKDYFDSIREQWDSMDSFTQTIAAASHGQTVGAVDKYFSKPINNNSMRDFLIVLVVWFFGIAVGAVITVAVNPPKVTHEVYLYKPKVKRAESVVFELQQIENDSTEERSMLRKLFRKRKGGENE